MVDQAQSMMDETQNWKARSDELIQVYDMSIK